MLRLLCGKLHRLSPPISHFHDFPPLCILRFLSSAAASNYDLVLSTFRSHDVADEHSRSILARRPRLLQADPDRILKPKLAFLRSSGLSGPELAEILLSNPSLLQRSLDRVLSPSVALLRSILPSNDAFIPVLKRINGYLPGKYEANIEILKDHGVPAPVIQKLLISRPRTFLRIPDKVASAVVYVKKLGLDPTTFSFANAVSVKSYLSDSTFQRKVELFKVLEWSDKQIMAMFIRYPFSFTLSDKMARTKLGYFKDVIGWGPDFMCAHPSLLSLSLDKRIIPRCAVLDVLISRGLVKKDTRLSSVIKINAELFYKDFVRQYEEVPEVIRAFQGKTKFSGWDWLKDARQTMESQKC